jgi:hypothetical protein
LILSPPWTPRSNGQVVVSSTLQSSLPSWVETEKEEKKKKKAKREKKKKKQKQKQQKHLH